MVAAETYFKASDGAQIFVRTWEPEAGRALRAVVVIHHGLGEHCGRYAVFAARLSVEGFAVVAFDARGHGRTSEAEGSPGLGKIACGKEGAVPRMVMDLAELIASTQSARPSTPLLLFGHSFGTVVARHCLAGTSPAPAPQRVAGVLLCGPPARIVAPMAVPFKVLIGGLHKIQGDYGISGLPSKLSFDKFQAKCMAANKHEGPVTGWEWLNRDPKEVQKYVDDPFCGHDVALGFWSSAVQALLDLKFADMYKALPADLPVCVQAGEHDFCTIDDFGVASYTRIQQEFASAGKATPKVVVYPQARHELLLETNADEVMEDAIAFFGRCLGAPRARL